MPRRHNTKRINGGPQGNDAFISVKKLAWSERDAYLEGLQKLLMDQESAFERGDSAKVADLNRAILSYAAERIVAWNWVDDDENTLPLPKDKPELVDQLYADEVTFLARETVKVLLGELDEKN
ncbi:MAG: hypothetical protein PHO55_07835 [Thiomonas arsenitoxydans]|nr:hypothetical protein [Thiomonas arsenitoxydans]